MFFNRARLAMRNWLCQKQKLIKTGFENEEDRGEYKTL